MDKDKLQQLAKAYLSGKATEKEKQQLHEWYDENTGEELEEVSTASGETQDQVRQRILSVIQQRTGMSENDGTPKVISFYNRAWIRIAAVFLLVSIGAASYLLYNNFSETISESPTSIAVNNDILPGQHKATLTLANGKVIILDSAGLGKLAQQGNTTVMHLNGELIYSDGEQPASKPLFNTLTTARGEIYPLTLSDGSKIWLNAESSIQFPVTFSGNNRMVEVTGEAFFEITANNQKPFIVKVGDASIQVLGTQFNVMAYHNESILKTTLLEGSVNFFKNESQVLLKPGQQSQLNSNGEIKILDHIDVQKEVAWKNGFFDFEGTDFETIARQLSRWYDVEVQYDKKVNELFYAKIPRNTKLSNVLRALELTGKVQFEIKGKNIIVKP